jgi:cytochrome c
MSKPLKSIFLPALGGTALALGIAVAMSSRDHGRAEIEMLKSRVAQVENHAVNARQSATDAANEITRLAADLAQAQNAGGDGRASLTRGVGENAVALGIGRAALPAEIAAWDVDVLPDGRGLPEGRGDAYNGEEIFADACASCHGDFAEGVGNWPVLAGGFDTLADKDPVKTVGSYWPYLSTVWDYVHRSMPFGNAQTLSDDDVYAIVAYILYSNDLVDEDFELSHENFADFAMYNADGFVIDDRATTEYPIWRNEPCMENCKPSVEITMRASILDVTPDEAVSETEAVSEAEAVSDQATANQANADQIDQSSDQPATDVITQAADPALVAAGAKVFKKCKSCHQVGAGAKNRSGPQLNGILGRAYGAADGFKYSSALMAAAADGRAWTAQELDGFLTKPKTYLKGTKMGFAGLKRQADRDAIIAYLGTLTD